MGLNTAASSLLAGSRAYRPSGTIVRAARPWLGRGTARATAQLSPTADGSRSSSTTAAPSPAGRKSSKGSTAGSRQPRARSPKGGAGSGSNKRSSSGGSSGKRAPEQPRLDPQQVAAQPSCQAAVDLVLSQPPKSGYSYAALDRALDLLLERGNRSDAADRAAAAALADHCWEPDRVRRLQRWPLLRLLKLAAAFGLASPLRLAAWQASLSASGGLAKLSAGQAIDLLEAVRVLHKTPEGAVACRELDPGLLQAALAHVFEASAPGQLEALPLRKLAMVYNAVGGLGLRLAPERHRQAAAAVGAALGRGDANVGLLAQLLASWGSMQAIYLSLRTSEEGAPGYPGSTVLEEVVQRLHQQRRVLGPGELSQLLAALGFLNYAPQGTVLADFVAALLPSLSGARGERGVGAALPALAKLGFDPGEAFVKACLEVVAADGGKDQSLLANVAWALAVLQHCTPERWAMLVGLLDERGCEGPGMDSKGPMRLRYWVTAYLLVLEQQQRTQLRGPSRPQRRQAESGNGAQPCGQQQQQQRQLGQQQMLPLQGGDGASSSGGGGGSTSSSSRGAGSSFGTGLVPLPAGVLEAGVAALRAANQARPQVQAGSCRHEVAQVLRELCRGRYSVEEQYCVECPSTGAPAVVVHVAVPDLKLAVQVQRYGERADHVRNTGAPTAAVLTRNRLLAHWGWRQVLMPSPGELAAQAAAMPAAQQPQQAQQQRGSGDGSSGGSSSRVVGRPGSSSGGGGRVGVRDGKGDAALPAEAGQQAQQGNSQERYNLRPVIRALLLQEPGMRQLLQPAPEGQGRQRRTSGEAPPRRRRQQGRQAVPGR